MRDINVNIYGDINLIIPDFDDFVEALDEFSDEEMCEEAEDEAREDEQEEDEVEALLAICNELLKEWAACEIHKASNEKIPGKEKEGR